MLRVLYWLIIVIPAAVLVICLAVANRHDARMVLDPFKPTDPTLYIDAPFYAFLFGGLFLGLILGGLASWMKQGKWRKTARERTHEAYRWEWRPIHLEPKHEAVHPALPHAS